MDVRDWKYTILCILLPFDPLTVYIFSSTLSTQNGDNAAEDDGPVPTKEEQEAIDEAIRNVLIPEGAESGALELEVDLLKAAPSNKKLFAVLKKVTEGTKMADPVDMNEKIDFVGRGDVEKVRECHSYTLLAFVPNMIPRTSLLTKPSHISNISCFV